MTDLYSAPNHANALFSQLGIDINNKNSTFNPQNQPKQIGAQFHNVGRQKSNKYVEQISTQSKQQVLSEDHQIPKKLQLDSLPIKKTAHPQKQQTKKGRKKQPKRFDKKNNTKNSNQNSKNSKQIEINIDTDQVAEWGQKGTKVNQQNQQQQFDDDQENMAQFQANTAQQQQIKRRIQQKLKKYQNPGSENNRSQSNSSSLKTKFQQLKRQNKQKNQVTVLGETFVHHEVDQSSQQYFSKPFSRQPKQVKSSQEMKQLKIQSKVSQQINMKKKAAVAEQQDDPWDKINQRTLNKKSEQADALKKAQQIDLNKYYQNLNLAYIQDPEQNMQPETGFLQSICACLQPKKKGYNQFEKQILKISKIQLTNKPQQTSMLKSIWTKLTNKKYLRYGQHWTQIGFQGRDPATDLRGAGILSLLNWYNFLNFDMDYATKIANFCVQFDIPLALTHIKITGLLIQSIKKRKLEGKTWNDYMNWYNILAYYTFDYLLQKVKKVEQIKQIVQIALQRTKNNLQVARNSFNLSSRKKG